MTKQERSNWFPVRERPHRCGWYEYHGPLLDGVIKQYWNGAQWGSWMGPGNRNWVQLAECDEDHWRGLTNTHVKTKWFPVSSRPQHPGWYEFRGFGTHAWRRYWNGSQWGFWLGPKDSSWVRVIPFVSDRWRGLTNSAGYSFSRPVNRRVK